MVFILQVTNCNQDLLTYSDDVENDNGVEFAIDNSPLVADVPAQEAQGEQYQTGADYGPDYLSENEEQNNYQDHSSSSSDNQDDSPNLDCTPDEFNTTSELSTVSNCWNYTGGAR
ncbi:uncharacterized protein LOC120353265 [Nilaparvata lugens]|uniref:uncharacterized protein LOC120353265 n=1 Tax=Nilaparvata lugens TaxID=108931 RepID=UPI00193E7823|nr:uncharacterized protein LOC120353265 [Nilaparvata lugens]